MSNLDELKAKRMAELQQQHQGHAQAEMQQQAQLEQQIAQLEAVVKRHMTREALERYGTLKVAHPEKAMQVLVVLSQLIQGGRLTQVTDSQLKEILVQLTPQKRDIKIVRK